MDFSKVKSIISNLNVIRRYFKYRDTLKTLSDNNTMEVSEFLSLDNEKRDLTLFCLIASTRIKQEAQSKLLYTILTASLAGTGIATYVGVI